MLPALLTLSLSYQIPFPTKDYASLRNGTTAYAALILAADKQLTTLCKPVTAKTTRVAASGDKHDYVSLSPYWWPDPDSPDGMPYHYRDGERNPEGYEYDRYTLGDFISSIDCLGWAYYFSNEIKYAEKAADNIRIFLLNEDTKMNPHLKYAQTIPGVDNGNGHSIGIIDIYEMIHSMPLMELVVDSGILSNDEIIALKKWYSDMVEWLMTSSLGKEERNAKNNHAIAFDVVATSFSIFSGEKSIAEGIIGEFATQRIFKQVEPDGHQPEELVRTIALHYCNYNLDHMLDMTERAITLGVNVYEANEGGRSIPSAVEWLSQFLGKPQSAFPYQQILNWDGEQNDLAWIVKRSLQFRKSASLSQLFDDCEGSTDSDRRWLTIGGQAGPV
jgi:hypothetical protein